MRPAPRARQIPLLRQRVRPIPASPERQDPLQSFSSYHSSSFEGKPKPGAPHRVLRGPFFRAGTLGATTHPFELLSAGRDEPAEPRPGRHHSILDYDVSAEQRPDDTATERPADEGTVGVAIEQVARHEHAVRGRGRRARDRRRSRPRGAPCRRARSAPPPRCSSPKRSPRASSRDPPRRRAASSGASGRPEIPPQIANASSPSFSSGGDGEWSEATIRSVPADAAPTTVPRPPRAGAAAASTSRVRRSAPRPRR